MVGVGLVVATGCKIAIGILWTSQMAYTLGFTTQDEDGEQDKKDLALSSVLYGILLLLVERL